ncbi:hypothetical protein FBY34_5951 [Streptomyces sp. SLBN-115]|nr:hypothetical protein FBY34_5951 [Streptomyces sp. SLBN-115]
MHSEERAKIVASLAKFYDYVVEKGGKDVPDSRVAAVISEAALIDFATTSRFLGEAKQLAEKTLDSVIGVHRERILMAEYYAQNPPSPAERAEADGYKRYAAHYRIGLDRGRDVCFGVKSPAASYPTAVDLERLHDSRYSQYLTLGDTEFAQPDKLADHIPQLAAPRPQAPPPVPPVHSQVRPAAPAHPQARPAAPVHPQCPPGYLPLSHYAPYGGSLPAFVPARSAPGVHPSGVAYAAGVHPRPSGVAYGAPGAGAAPAAWHPATAALHAPVSHGHGYGAHLPAGGRAPHSGVPQPHFPHPGVPSPGGAYGGVYRAPAPNQRHGTCPGQ